MINAFMALLFTNEFSSGYVKFGNVDSAIIGFPTVSWPDRSRVALSIPTLSDEVFDFISLFSLAVFVGLS